MAQPEVPRVARDKSPIATVAPEKTRGEHMLVIGAGVLVAIALAPLGVGLATALILYEIWARPYALVAQRVPSGFAAALTTVAAFAIVAGPLIWLGHHLIERLPAVRAALANSSVPQPNNSAGAVIPLIQAQVANAVGSATDWLPGVLLPAGRNAAAALVNWSIALFGLFYLLVGANTSSMRLARVLPLSVSAVETLRQRFRDITQGVVAGTLLSAAVQGLAIGIGFRLAGLPDASFWGASAAIATLIPVVGNAAVWVPALALMIVRQHYEGAIAIGVFGGLMPPIIDRVIRATVSRHVGRVHPMITLVGALAGARLVGVAGLILGPVALAMFFALIEIYNTEYSDYHEISRGDQPQYTHPQEAL